MTQKQQFLLEHNKLSPSNLQATIALLSRFKIEKYSLFKDNNWSIDRLRRPFILWLTSLTTEERENIRKKENTRKSDGPNKNRSRTKHHRFLKKHRNKK